ncbi:MAG: HPr(Ser) kinase/phosphatase, partial [Salinispira sp.]
MQTITVLEFLNLDLKEHDALRLRCIAGRPGLTREIRFPNVNRPGLTMNGFFDNFAVDRIQLFGRGEHAFLEKIGNDPDHGSKVKNLEILFTSGTPCVVLSHNLEPTRDILELADKTGTPILQTDLSSSEFTSRAILALNMVFAKTTVTHGVLVEVFGIGIFITGESGVGKSESALELIHRGHRIVGDDMIEIRNVSGNVLVGTAANNVLKHHMEIRGLGIINIAHLFGVGAIRDHKQIQLIVELEPWKSGKEYDRL